MIPAKVEEYFALQRERYRILLRRRTGQPWPWTDDPFLRQYKFTNTFREDDKTTIWFRENVREGLRDSPECLLATVVYRWFCKAEIGQVIFCMPDLLHGGKTPWEVLLETGSVGAMRHGIRNAYPDGPYVTGAYTLSSAPGMNKLDGMLSYVDAFYHTSDWCKLAGAMLSTKGLNKDLPVTMEEFTRWLQQFRGQGPFTAYEVACDLQYTSLLNRAPDIFTWANVGPGARRGLNRLSDRQREKWPDGKMRKKWGLVIKEPQALEEMQFLLQCARDPRYWPQDWPPWTMREVENGLCEFDKMQRLINGEGTPRQLYRRP